MSARKFNFANIIYKVSDRGHGTVRKLIANSSK